MTGQRPRGNTRSPLQHATAFSTERLAKRRLSESRDYARYFRDISVSYRSGVLTLSGCLPSFYLKQVLQTLLRDLEGVERIENLVQVAGASSRAVFPRSNADFGKAAEHIRNACELLSDHATPLRKRLLDAAIEFLSATHFDDEWPAELRRAANRIKLAVLSRGDVSSSVQAMDEETLDATAEELFLFTKEAQQLTAVVHTRRSTSQPGVLRP